MTEATMTKDQAFGVDFLELCTKYPGVTQSGKPMVNLTNVEIAEKLGIRKSTVENGEPVDIPDAARVSTLRSNISKDIDMCSIFNELHPEWAGEIPVCKRQKKGRKSKRAKKSTLLELAKARIAALNNY